MDRDGSPRSPLRISQSCHASPRLSTSTLTTASFAAHLAASDAGRGVEPPDIEISRSVNTRVDESGSARQDGGEACDVDDIDAHADHRRGQVAEQGATPP